MKRKLLCLLVVLALVLSIPIPGHAASSLKASDDCISVIKAFEGFSGTPYLDTDGKYTIGYGTRCPSSKVEYYTNNPMSKEEATQELREAVAAYEKAVNNFADKHGVTYTQGQFDGIISLVYNCGTGCLSTGSTLIRALSQGHTGNDLLYAFSIYSMNGSKRSVPHVKRRLAEANMYLYGVYSRYAPDYFSYVLYNANGGEVEKYNVQGYEITNPATPIPTATYEGKTFLGWYTKASGGIKVTKLDASTKEMTLYAHWGTGSAAEQPEEPDTSVSKITGMLIPSGTPITAVKVTVTSGSVNLRKGPGTSYPLVGTATQGNCYTVTATHQDGRYLWGRYDGGWICLDYTNYEDLTSAQPDNNVSSGTTSSSSTKTYATVTGTDNLNVRNKPDGAVIGNLARGTKVEILEQKTVNDRLWGRYSGGWICLRSYVKLETVSVTPTTVTKTYATVIDTDALNVRNEPDGDVIGSLAKGKKVEILEQKMAGGRLWGRYSGGWICLRSYVKLETVTQVVYRTAQARHSLKAGVRTAAKGGTVTASCLNIRSAPGTDNPVVSHYYRGAAVQIHQYATAGDRPWGLTDAGWICLEYVKFA